MDKKILMLASTPKSLLSEQTGVVALIKRVREQQPFVHKIGFTQRTILYLLVMIKVKQNNRWKPLNAVS